MASNFIQAFKQAPWRVQMQRIGLVLTGLVSFALIAGLYLSISASTYAVGVEVKELDWFKEELLRQNADLSTQKARLLSSTEMKRRAQEMGFISPSPQEFVYIVVEGYQGRQLEIPPKPPKSDVKQYLIKPDYRQSLWEYLFQGILILGQNSGVLQ